MVHTRFSSGSRSLSVVSVSPSKHKSKVSPKKMKVKNAKLRIKSKKEKLAFRADLFPPPEGMAYDIAPEKHKTAKISTMNKYDPITGLRALLSPKQLDDFRASCFGQFTELPTFKIQYQLIHNLLLRQLKQPNPHEIWIGLGGMKLRFGIEEFAIVTGLRCVGNADKNRFSKTENTFVSTYYEGINNISKSCVKNSFYGKEWKTDKDAVKMANLFVLHHFLLSSSFDSQIPRGDLDIFYSEDCEQFPWGKEVFRVTLDSLRNSLRTNSKDNYYRLNGFPYAFQVWFYECCPYLNGKYCNHNSGSVPRILNWSNDYLAKFEEAYTTLSLNADELQLRNLSPTKQEIETMRLEELVVKRKKLNISCDNICATVSDDDFVDPPVCQRTAGEELFVKSKKTVDVSSSSVPTQDKTSLKKIEKKLSSLEASQKSLFSEVENLKTIVNEQRAYIDSSLLKLRDTILKKAGVPNEDDGNLNYESNDGGFIFDEHIRDEVPTRTPEAMGVHEGLDFSPNTMDALENVLHTIDAATKQQDVVAEVEVSVAEGADKVAEHGDKFAKETVEREEFAGNSKEVEENSVLKVAREIYESTILDEPMDEPETAVEKASDVEMKDGGSSTSAVVKATPALPKRSIKLPAYLLSPFLQHFGTSAKEPTETTNVDHFKGISPLDSNIGVLPDLDISSDYYTWLDTGLSMNNNKRKFYSKQDNVISPPMKLGCELVSQKTWFHSIEYGSTDLSNSHVDVFFYYLRKLSKHGTQCQMKFTTPDCKFYKALSSLYYDSDVHLYSAASESDKIQNKITEKRGILDMLNGTSLPFSTPWYLADYVLVPLWLADPRHWVLAVIDLKQRFISVRNTLSGQGVSVILTKAILPLSKILPHYLLMTDFYSRTDIDFSAKCYAEPPRTHCFNTFMKNPYVCRDSLDSGVAIVSIAEYFVLAKDFPKDSFDVAIHRSRLSFSFYAYAMAKHIYEYESEQEYFNDARVEAVSKRTRAGKRQTRTRKCARKGAKASPIRIE